MSTVTIEKKTGFFIFGSTGCSCCRNENFFQGPIEQEAAALERAESHEKRRTVASQYSRTGLYAVRKIEYEYISDGRIIIGNRLFTDDYIYESGDVANELDHLGEKIAEAGKYDKN